MGAPCWCIGPPSLQAMDGGEGALFWMASEATDMRCGFDRLAERMRAVIGENPQCGHLFVWCPYPTSASNVASAKQPSDPEFHRRLLEPIAVLGGWLRQGTLRCMFSY